MKVKSKVEEIKLKSKSSKKLRSRVTEKKESFIGMDTIEE